MMTMTAAAKHSRQLSATVAVAVIGWLWIGSTEHLAAVPPTDGQTAAASEASGTADAVNEAAAAASEDLPATVDEARGRARMLHETLHGVLQVVHRDFFREDESLMLPSQSLEDVFAALADQWGVQIRWLAVDAAAMNVDHQPRDAFEKRAVAALAKGATEYAAVEEGRYRHAGTIQLSSQCLKCHLPRRTSTEDRAAGLVISLPLQPKR